MAARRARERGGIWKTDDVWACGMRVKIRMRQRVRRFVAQATRGFLFF